MMGMCGRAGRGGVTRRARGARRQRGGALAGGVHRRQAGSTLRTRSLRRDISSNTSCGRKHAGYGIKDHSHWSSCEWRLMTKHG